MKGTTVWLDLETAGVEDKHPTIQIAAIAERGWEELSCFEAKIRFDEANADPEALRLNSYERDLWERDAVYGDEALQEMAAWMRPYRELEKVSRRGNVYTVCRAAGHNITLFDGPRLIRGFKAFDIFCPAALYEALDTRQLAQWHFADAETRPENVKLETLCAFFGIENEAAHDALGDVRATMRVAEAMLS